MKRRIFVFFTLLLMAGVAIGIMVSPHLLRGKTPEQALTPLRGTEVSDVWPTSKSWVWNVDPIATKSHVCLSIRTVKIPYMKGGPVYTDPKLPEKGEEVRTGWIVVGDKPLPGRVTCQTIDFRDVGLEDTMKKPLRLLVNLRIQGGLSKRVSILPGDSFEGLQEVEPKWVGDECQLMVVYTRTETTLYSHHVLIQQRDRP